MDKGHRPSDSENEQFNLSVRYSWLKVERGASEIKFYVITLHQSNLHVITQTKATMQFIMNLLVSVDIAVRESSWRYTAFQFKCISHKWRSLSSSVSLPLSCFSVIKCFVPQIASSSAFQSQSLTQFRLPRRFSAAYLFTWLEQGAAYGRAARFLMKPWMICKETKRNNAAFYYGFSYIPLESANDTLRKTRDHRWGFKLPISH